MRGVVYVNGTITPADQAVVPVYDHGFVYGEGVYETLRTYARKPFLFKEHMDRLRRSAAIIGLPVAISDAAMAMEIERTCAQCAAEPGNDELYIRILLTRGVGELSYHPDATPTQTLVIIVKPLPLFPDASFTKGIRVALVDVRRNHPRALNPMIKSNNLLNNAMAMQEAYRRGAEEALMCNQDGRIVECSQSNFFIVSDGALLTPPISQGLLPGITRQYVLELARRIGIDAEEAAMSPEHVFAADEAFITGTTREITPVTFVDDTAIGDGAPGPVTRQLMSAFTTRALTT